MYQNLTRVATAVTPWAQTTKPFEVARLMEHDYETPIQWLQTGQQCKRIYACWDHWDHVRIYAC